MSLFSLSGLPAMSRTIVLAGSLAQRPGHGGHAWVFLQYLLGFRRLGFDVLFLDSLTPGMCFDAAGAPCPFARSRNVTYLQEVMDGFGLDDSFSLCDEGDDQTVGLTRSEVLERVRGALLINVMGYLNDEEILDECGQRVFLDIDPGFGQMWQAQGLCQMFSGHDRYVTIGLNVGRPECEIPTCGIAWITTPQPVVLELWPMQPPNLHSSSFTSIASWRGPFGPIEHDGRHYGLRVHEFRKFLGLPEASRCDFELALDIDSRETADLERLTRSGWRLRDPREVAGEPWRYRRYIQESFAEFMVAKGLYVAARSGWVSDRSICYLASGRPVLAQDTGLRHIFPDDQGLLLFSTLEEAVSGIHKLRNDPVRHAAAARQLAEMHFNSDIVLRRLLENLGADDQ